MIRDNPQQRQIRSLNRVVLFRRCDMGLEGLVSKHSDRPYRGGRQKYWIKVKNRKHPAMHRVMDALEHWRS